MLTYCTNCGCQGHIYKDCREPITSYGIIAFHKTTNQEIKFLNINRKHSIAFTEFIRGKYMYNNDNKYKLNTEYVFILFKNMSKSERNLIETLSFDQLWKKWIPTFQQIKQAKGVKYENYYIYAKNKYEKFKQGIRIKNNTYSIKSVMNKTFSVYDSPEWGFPKGRNDRETGLNCALREFKEETDLDSSKLKIINKTPVFEEYMGFNDNMYRNIYYMAEFISTDIEDYQTVVELNNNNKLQNLEISNVCWLSNDETLEKIRPYHSERKKILKRVNDYIITQYYINNVHIYEIPTSNTSNITNVIQSVLEPSDISECLNNKHNDIYITHPSADDWCIRKLLPNLNMF